VANSGGIINGCRELLGWDSAKAAKKSTIFTTAYSQFLKWQRKNICHRLERLNTWLVE
jgi:hypothetical protein